MKLSGVTCDEMKFWCGEMERSDVAKSLFLYRLELLFLEVGGVTCAEMDFGVVK